MATSNGANRMAEGRDNLAADLSELMDGVNWLRMLAD